MGLRIKLLFLLPAVLGLASSMRADVTTYTYSGADFTFVSGPYTTSDHLTGSFTAATLGNNLSYAPLDVYSYDFTDGVRTLTGSYLIVGNVSTDATGAIVEWYLNLGVLGSECITQGGYLPGNVAVDQCEIDSGYSGLGEVLHSNGSWTMVTSPTPEPSAFALLATGSLGLMALARRRSSPVVRRVSLVRPTS